MLHYIFFMRRGRFLCRHYHEKLEMPGVATLPTAPKAMYYMSRMDAEKRESIFEGAMIIIILHYRYYVPTRPVYVTMSNA